MSISLKVTLIFGLLFVISTSIVIFGGSMIWLLGGAQSLNIEGTAELIDRTDDPVRNANGWSYYGGDEGGNRYSQATQINKGNISHLVPDWEYKTGDMTNRADYMRFSAAEGTPILVNDALIFCTPFNEVIALHPGNGNELWRFDPKLDLLQEPANQFVCRGVAHWRDPDGESICADRIFMGTNDARLISIDASTGERCSDFGDNGEVHIDPGMPLLWKGEFQITSPPVTVRDTVVVGSAIADGPRVAAPVGAVRAFDTRTGESRWEWDPIPRAKDNEAASSWHGKHPPNEGHANAWAPMSVDEDLGLVFVPTSSPSPDFYGGLRPGDNRHANSVVALEGETGAVRWSFQTVHHDIWDYDVPAQPGLYSVWRDGTSHDVVVQVTKMGLVFVLDRATGEPFIPIEERPVPQSGAPGEWLSPTQPFPIAPPPLVPSRISPDDAFGVTLIDRLACRSQITGLKAEGLYTPPSQQGTLFYPFTGGGANWGSASFDPMRNLLILNVNNLAHEIQLIPSDQVETAQKVFHDQEIAPQSGAPFGVRRNLLLSPFGVLCTQPPWGLLVAVDLASGEIVWRKALGEMYGINLGLPGVGGSIVTAGGLVFVGATMDNMLRAFDIETGDLLWDWELPAAGQATPMTYVWDNRQYVVIYAGGNARAVGDLGDSVIAFALAAKKGPASR